MCLITFFSFTILTNKAKYQVITMQELLIFFLNASKQNILESKETELFNHISLSCLIIGNITRKH